MLINLTRNVIVRGQDGKFHTVPAGTGVNYSSEHRDGSWIHKFICFAKDKQTILTYIETSADGQPPAWM
jgi:hypothetical protein